MAGGASCARIMAAGVVFAILGALGAFLGCFALWVAGAILIDEADDKNRENTEYKIGFILMMVSAGFAGLGCLVGFCHGLCVGVEIEND